MTGARLTRWLYSRATAFEAFRRPRRAESIFLVIADDVTIQGFTLDGQNLGPVSVRTFSHGVFVDGGRNIGGPIHRFVLRGNVVENVGVGLTTVIGTFSGNEVAGNGRSAALFTFTTARSRLSTTTTQPRARTTARRSTTP